MLRAGGVRDFVAGAGDSRSTGFRSTGFRSTDVRSTEYRSTGVRCTRLQEHLFAGVRCARSTVYQEHSCQEQAVADLIVCSKERETEKKW